MFNPLSVMCLHSDVIYIDDYFYLQVVHHLTSMNESCVAHTVILCDGVAVVEQWVKVRCCCWLMLVGAEQHCWQRCAMTGVKYFIWALQLLSPLIIFELLHNSFTWVVPIVLVHTLLHKGCDSVTLVKMRLLSCCGDLPTLAQWSRCIHLRYTRPWEFSSSHTIFNTSLIQIEV